jgi:hypothetical protein
MLGLAGALTLGVATAANVAVEGAVFPSIVVSAPAGCQSFSAAPTIDWGDGQPASTGQCGSDGVSVVTGPHTYAEEGSYSGVASYTSPNGARTSSFQVQVSDAALSGSAVAVTGAASVPFAGPLASFGDADPGATASDYTATITWGDGSSSPGVVQASGTGFSVTGAHTYAVAGSFTTSTTINDAGGSNTTVAGAATVTTAPTTAPPPGGTFPPRATFTMPASIGAGQTLTLDASPSRQPGVTIATYRWTVNGRQLANCAGATSQLMTRTLPVGNDTIGLTLLGPSGPLATATQNVLVRATAAVARGRVRIVKLPEVATCLLAPSDPPSGRVSPGVAYAPSPDCRTQVQSGVVDAVGCLTEYQDTIQVSFVRHQRGHLGSQHVSLPPGQQGLDGVGSAADTTQLLQDVENALNPSLPRTCVDSNGNDFICSTVGQEQQPAGPTFGGAPVQGGGPVNGLARRAAAGRVVAAAARAPAQSIAFAGAACTTAPSGKSQGEPECLDLWVSGGPVRVNGIDYAPPPGGEIVIAPQFNLVVSERASTSLDGLFLNASHPFQPVNFELPASSAGGGTSGIDYPALTVPDLPGDIKQQRSSPAAAAIIAALGAVGGFPSTGALEISFDDQTATVTFHVQLPAPFDGGDGAPVTAEVKARIGPTEPFHVVYGYLGNTSGGSSVDLGPVALNGFGICYRQHYSTDASVDPCPGITGIDDAGLGDGVWTASASLNIADALNVEFRPGSNTIPGCSQAIPLGFAFSGDGGLSQAGAALDLAGSGGVPIFPGVSITGVAAGFSSKANYEVYSGCVGLSVVDLLSITGNVFGVHTVNGYRYNFTGTELARTCCRRRAGPSPTPTMSGSAPAASHRSPCPSSRHSRSGTPTRSPLTTPRRSSSARGLTPASRTAITRTRRARALPSRVGSRERSAWAPASRRPSTSRATPRSRLAPWGST